MRFLVDAQLSRRLIERLLQRGHDATHVFDHLPRTANDPDIADLASELAAVVISMDADFVELSRRGVLRQPLVWVRTGNVRTDELWVKFGPLLEQTVALIEGGALVVEIR